MSEHTRVLREISIDELFNQKEQYIIPIYQRNYAWSNSEREQLLDDLYDVVHKDEEYFLGSLVVHERDEFVYEVIDGQQRLTTLFILLAALGKNVPSRSLRFAARERSNHTLEKISEGLSHYVDESFYSGELISAWEQFKQQLPKISKITTKFADIKLLRIIVPEDTDLNHYFEIMNTRGEQLEAHEILKARLMSRMTGPNVHIKRNIFSIIWDACSQMSTYVQMNFKRKVRQRLFGKTLNNFNVDNFAEIVEKLSSVEDAEADTLSSTMSVIDAIHTYNRLELEDEDEASEEKAYRFDSIIRFPNFLLHTLKLYRSEDAGLYPDDTLKGDNSLNDNSLLDIFQADVDPERFIYLLLEVRYLFDQYIIKREYANSEGEGKWSLQRLKAYETSVDYVNTYTGNDTEDKIYKQIRTLQSALRITYTSPKTMHWITQSLSFLHQNKQHNPSSYLKMLETYTRKKVSENLSVVTEGLEMERIVFTYLDYLLWRDGYDSIKPMERYEFTFRDSIEHFYPRNPDKYGEHLPLKSTVLNHLGNLCLITSSDNSRLSNRDPFVKASDRKVRESSPKLRIMASITNQKRRWTEREIIKHGEEMLAVINDELNKESI